ncbi:metallophosphoesterase family protein [[Eubacterium] cellulosolvens]
MIDKKTRNQLYEFDKESLNRLSKLAVVGDIHGDLDILYSILGVVDPKKDGIIFLGDYADRGPKGFDVIKTIDSLIKRYPTNIVALKGNHEDYSDSGNPKFHPCDLIYEVENKGESWQRYFQEELMPFIDKLYLAAIIPDEILFVHGGISSKIKNVDNLKHPIREIEIDVLWSDPFEGNGEYPNRRGAGIEFGEDITVNLCNSLRIKRLIRSHEPRKAISGPYYEHNRKAITLSSTSVYGGKPFILLIDPKEPFNLSYHFL